MRYFKKKIILTLLGILILIALFSCVSYFTFAFTFSNNNKPKFTSAIDYYVFDEEDDYFGPINNLGKYDDYSYFRIDNKEGLMAFQKSVNNGWNFNGKEVCLNSNIDFEGGEFDGVGDQHLESGLDKFEGVFDGQGFTVSNYKSNVTNTTSNNQVRGFFNEIQNGAEVKNLRIKDVTYSVSYSSTKKFVGGVVGQVTDYGSDGVSKINNCVVENLTIIL